MVEEHKGLHLCFLYFTSAAPKEPSDAQSTKKAAELIPFPVISKMLINNLAKLMLLFGAAAMLVIDDNGFEAPTPKFVESCKRLVNFAMLSTEEKKCSLEVLLLRLLAKSHNPKNEVAVKKNILHRRYSICGTSVSLHSILVCLDRSVMPLYIRRRLRLRPIAIEHIRFAEAGDPTWLLAELLAYSALDRSKAMDRVYFDDSHTEKILMKPVPDNIRDYVMGIPLHKGENVSVGKHAASTLYWFLKTVLSDPSL